MNYTAKEIATLLNGKIEGNPNRKVNSVAKIEHGKQGNLCFLANEKYKNYIYTTKASVIIVNKTFKIDKKIQSTLIKVNDSYSSFSKLLEIYNKMKFNYVGISKFTDLKENTKFGKKIYIGSFTTINKNVKIGKNVKIHENCFIGENVEIGDNCILFPNVVIYHDCIIGNNTIIHSGVVIGSDGFGFAPSSKKNYQKISQIGNVNIEDNVEIGANTTIDRATMGSTKIGKGVKLDNLIQIAHNVEIGSDTVIAAQAAIAGSTKIGKRCMIGGQTAISGHIKVADDVKIAGQSGIASDINKKGSIVQGPMAFNIKEFQRSYIIFKKLPEMYKTLNLIHKQFNE